MEKEFILLLVNTTINVIIIGGLLFRWQKKIGSKFDEELENHKKEIIKEINEHKIKCEKNYLKEFDILIELHKNLKKTLDEFKKLASAVKTNVRLKEYNKIDAKIFEDNVRHLNNFIEENLLFINNDLVNIVKELDNNFYSLLCLLVYYSFDKSPFCRGGEGNSFMTQNEKEENLDRIFKEEIPRIETKMKEIEELIKHNLRD